MTELQLRILSFLTEDPDSSATMIAIRLAVAPSSASLALRDLQRKHHVSVHTDDEGVERWAVII